ncbi:PQQ-binding-like beta-propeller repeat protein [Streptomyces vietnamensis]|uniref:protein kinase domain-containing protein n=1 Tax=Streptomyces vietnamensis TaxID=362257 RepID=UPI00378C36CF
MERLRADDPREAGPYALVARLGAGGMGAVYLGRSSGGRTVAVKMVRPDLALDGAFRDRFRHEVAAARRVSGAFTAPVVDADPDARTPWMATAFVVGVSLHRAVGTHGPLPEDALRMLTAGLAEALAGIHSARVIHRDLKPANVLLALDGPHVIDFGIARATDGTALTSTGSVIGSAPYMSPEQALGQHLTPASDVFSLGTTVAFAACGESPFGDGASAAVLFRVVHTEPDLSAVPASVRPLIERCLDKDPERRPSPREVIAYVEGLGRRPDPRLGHGSDPRLGYGSDPRLGYGQGSRQDRPAEAAGWLPDRVAAEVLALRAALAAPPEPEPTVPFTGPLEDLVPPPGGPGPAPGRRTLLLGLAGGALAVAGAGTVWALNRKGSGTEGGASAGAAGGTPGPSRSSRPSPESVPDAKLTWQTKLPAAAVQVLPGDGVVACVTLEQIMGLDRRGRTAWTVKSADHDMYFSVMGTAALTVAATDGKRLYVSGAGLKPQAGGSGLNSRVLSVRMADGKDPWTAALTEHRSGSGIGFPGVRGGRAYLLPLLTDESSTNELGVWAVDLATRRTAWLHTARAMPVFWSLPRSGGGLLYADTERIVAVDAKGRAAWSKEFRAGLVGAAGTYYLLVDHQGTLTAMDVATGRRAWTVPDVIGASRLGDGVATDERGTVAFVLVRDADGFTLTALDAATGRARWRSPVPSEPAGSSPGTRLLYADGNVYRIGADGMVWAFDAANGAPRWKYGGFKGISPANLAWAAGDRRLCIADTGATTVAALDANGA